MTSNYIELQGLRVRYSISGSEKGGPPLLILNGIGQSLEVLEPLIKGLGSRHTIVFDVPGAGGTDTPTLPWRMKRYARFTSALLSALSISQVDVLGFSWGGTLALHFARYYPQKVRRIVLAAAPPGNLMIPGNPGVYARMMNPRRFSQPDYMRAIAPVIYGGAVRHSLDVVNKNNSQLVRPSARGYIYQSMTMVGTTALLWLNRLRQPVLILQGIDDPMVPNLNALLMSKLLRYSELSFIDCGHMLLLTRTQEAVKKIQSFLNREEAAVRR